MKSITKIIVYMLALLTAGSLCAASAGSEITVTLASNPSTGFEWVCYTAGGYSAVIEGGAFICDDPNHDLCGAPGKSTWTVRPVSPGRTIIVFEYARPWEADDPMQRRILLADVDTGMKLTYSWLPDSSIITGRVSDIDGNTVTLETENGPYIAAFPEDEALPVKDEEIKIYTDGTMGLSLPPFVNVIGWAAVPSSLAR